MEKTISTQDMKDLTDLRKYFMLKNVSVSVPGDCPYCYEHFVVNDIIIQLDDQILDILLLHDQIFTI